LYGADLIGSYPSPSEMTNSKKLTKNIDREVDPIFNLDGAKLNSANSELPMKLSGVNLSSARLNNANLQEIDLYRAVLENAFLNQADLRKALLEHSNMKQVKLFGANLSGAFLDNADLTNADLRDADLRDADLRDADLTDANLEKAYLCGADLRDANLTNAIIDENTNFELAQYTAKTVWPAGFNPKGKNLKVFQDINPISIELQNEIDTKCKKPKK
jgi:hypothetical protein